VQLAFPEDRPSVAVLPFNNMSADAEQEYFVDGIVEDIITGLSRIRWLHVLARNSTFTYKGRAVDVKQLGRDLGARYVLEGSLRKAGNRVRITAQLIEATSGAHVWAERYDRALDDIFELQDEITVSLVGAIEPSLRQAEIERAKRKRPENLDAYDLYLRALQHAYVPMPGEADKALVLLDQALALDPEYPPAHATAAWCYEIRYLRGGLHEANKAAALRHAHAAIEGGADDAGTLATAGFVIGLVAHDYKTAMEVIDRALTLTGASGTALWMGAIVLAHAGDTGKAIDYAGRSLRLIPFGRESCFAYGALAMAHCALGNFEAAAAASAKAVQANQRFSLNHVLHAAALSRLERTDEARAAARRILECEPDFTVSGFVRAHTGRIEIWGPIGDALRRLDLPE
jgi:TolB-like protein